MFWKDFFYFSRKERLGIRILLVLIAIALGLLAFLKSREERQLWQATAEDSVWVAAYDSFYVSLQTKARKEENRSFASMEAQVELFFFDPNRADSADFVRMGLRPYVARNILRYRAKGGFFKEPDALAKIYGLSEDDFLRIRPYVQIEKSMQNPSSNRLSVAEATAPSVPQSSNFESSKYPNVPKYPVGTLLELNAADTASLKKIPGIGTVTARRIVAYRDRLGGFYSPKQLLEIRNVPDSLLIWFYIDTPPQRVLLMNQFSVEYLSAHPYLNFYQAKVIVEHRRKRGNLDRLEQLSLYEEFSPSDLERLRHYIQF